LSGTRHLALRESELLGLCCVDFDPDTGALTVTGKLVRATWENRLRLHFAGLEPPDKRDSEKHRSLGFVLCDFVR